MHSNDELFTAGENFTVPSAEASRQAVDALRGYAYQITVAAAEWIDIDEHTCIFLEVAEDYAAVAQSSLRAVQVKDTHGSGVVTLNSLNIREAIKNFINLTHENPSLRVQFDYFTSSSIGTEKSNGLPALPLPGLKLWRQLARSGDVSQLRVWLTSDRFSDEVKTFVSERTDKQLRTDLLQKIRWNCGQPDYNTLTDELIDRFTVVGKERFDLSAQESAKIVPVILHHVLKMSLLKQTSMRSLTRASFIRLVDSYTHITVARRTYQNLLQGKEQSHYFNTATGTVSWLYESTQGYLITGLLYRDTLIQNVSEIAENKGVCFIAGSSGMGKTLAARQAAGATSNSYWMADFRDLPENEAGQRIHMLVSRLGAFKSRYLIIEDFNCIHVMRLNKSVMQLFETLRRRNIIVIITCYSAPSHRMLQQAGIADAGIIQCPYLTEDEACQLVTMNGGVPELWGRLAHLSGGSGHPQLVHAFISGMASRGWPASEIPGILKTGLSTNDLDAERLNVRNTVINALSTEIREMLYRLSLITGNFTREVALNISTAPPPVTLPGEIFDKLTGPWIEIMNGGQYRISPLASKSGKETLPLLLQQEIHRKIAGLYFPKSGKISTDSIDKIILHAMEGNDKLVLMKLATNLLTAGEFVLQYMLDNNSVLLHLPLGTQAYPDDFGLSCTLRLVQLKVILLTRNKNQIKNCWDTVQTELSAGSMHAHQQHFRVLAMTTFLNTTGVAELFNGWLPLLISYKKITDTDPSMKGLLKENAPDAFGTDELVPLFFATGLTGITCRTTLQSVISGLHGMACAERNRFLSFIQTHNPDFSILIHVPLIAHSSNDDIKSSIDLYRNIALQTTSWNIPALNAQCWIAAAMMTAENQQNTQAGLALLEEAIRVKADPARICQAKMRIYWREKRYNEICILMRQMASNVYTDNPLDRTYALREAAISAANTGDWELAAEWFILSRTAAAAVDLPDFRALAVGLLADSAVASQMSGHTKRALTQISDALEELESISPEQSLQAYYAHQVIRHAILWMMSVIEEDTNIEINNMPVTIMAGCCSNPTPPEAIRLRPLAAPEAIWYLVAQMDVSACTGLSLEKKLPERSEHYGIPMLETSLRFRLLYRALVDQNPAMFISSMKSFLMNWHFLSRNRPGLSVQDGLHFKWESIPPLPEQSTDELISEVDRLLISYFIVAACKGREVPLALLEESIETELGKEFARSCILSKAQDPHTEGAQMLQSILKAGRGNTIRPVNYCLAGIHALTQAGGSIFRQQLVPHIALWQRQVWGNIITRQRFDLITPALFVPDLAAILSNENNDAQFLIKLMTKAAQATNISISQTALAGMLWGSSPERLKTQN